MILLKATYISKDYSYLTYACLNIRTKCHLPDKMTQPNVFYREKSAKLLLHLPVSRISNISMHEKQRNIIHRFQCLRVHAKFCD